MSHFAEISDTNIVLQVIVAEPEFINSGAVGNPDNWVQTSYNTFAGNHKLGGTPLRKNYAGIGYTYDKTRDAFIPPKQFDSWILDEDTCQWRPPVTHPIDNNQYAWNENTLSWDLVE